MTGGTFDVPRMGLRFVGELPVWLGVSLALLVAIMAWRYYRRESFDLPHRLRWALPLLRSLAFALGILVLTGPVLEHRTVIGQLGRVKVYVDASASMNLLDQHLSTGRKLLIAEQQGWLEPGLIDPKFLNLATAIATTREQTLTELKKENPLEADLARLRDGLIASIKAATDASKAKQIIDRLNSVKPSETATAVEQLTQICKQTPDIETELTDAFDKQIARLSDSGNDSVQAALDMFNEAPRWRRVEQSLLASSSPLFKELRRYHEVEVFALQNGEAIKLFDNQTPDDTAEFPESATAATTDLISGITATQAANVRSETTTGTATESLQTNTAIVLFTDGQHNNGPSPLQTARVLGGQGVAFYPVSFGATDRTPDLAVTKVEHPQIAFRKDRVRGTVVVLDHMPASQTMVVQVSSEDEVLWEQQLVTNGSGERRIDYEFKIDALVEERVTALIGDTKQHAVPLNLTASVSPLAGETETDNNQRAFRFAAITSNQRLMILDGRSRWETRYLRNVFERDRQWDVNAIIAGPGNDQKTLPHGKDGFPETRDELFDYDLIIFGEVAAELFADHEFKWLREFVETRGGGLIFIDGQRQRLRAFNEQNLGPLLPVEWNAEPLTVKPTSLQLTDKGTREPSLTFESEAQANKRFWTELPPPHTPNNVTALPGAETLIEVMVSNEPKPVMITRRIGAGRVLYLASDETWRWRYKAADTYHQRIWNQLAKFVMPRPFAASDEYLAIDTGPVSYASGESSDIRIQLNGLDGKPAIDATVDALIWKDGRVVFTAGLAPDPDVPGLYRGNSGELTEGEYEVSIRASGFSEQALKARSSFVVRPPETGELTETACNENLLRQMASASGGTYLREEQIAQLPDLLKPLSSGRVEESTTVLWQSYWWFAAIIILLSLEWFLRKRAGLL